MKVLQLLKTSNGATWALRQTRELVKLGVEVHVALPEGPLVGNYKKNGVVTHICDINCRVMKPWDWFKRGRILKTLVNAVKPDLVHSHFVGTTFAMRIGLRDMLKLPRVFQVPGPMHLEYFIFRNLELLLSQKQDNWIASCEWTRTCYEKCGIKPERLFLSYYGVDIEDFQLRNTNKLRKELQLSDKEKLIGIVSFLYPPRWYLFQKRGNKGHEDLIDAVSICLKRGIRIKCVIIGGAWEKAYWYEKRIKKYAKEKCGDAVVFIGTRNDVQDLYLDLDLVVHPSHSENVGGAVESLLLARPTITTDIGGFPDLVKDGETGYLVPAKAPKALAKKIEYVLSHYDEAIQLAKAGSSLSRHMFDMRKNARDVYNAYKTILDRN